MKNQSRINDMIGLRNSGLSLQEIADRFSISRERVRQLIGNTGKDFLRKHAEKNIPEVSFNSVVSDFKNNRFAKLAINVLRSISHRIQGGYAKDGQDIEIKVSQKLSDLGFENKLMPINRPFDILTKENIKIEVKACFIKWFPARAKSGLYRFGVKKDSRGDYCDFFVCYISEHDVYFVIPNHEVGYVHTVYIPYPITPRHWTKWKQYENKFDLIKKG